VSLLVAMVGVIAYGEDNSKGSSTQENRYKDPKVFVATTPINLKSEATVQQGKQDKAKSDASKTDDKKN
jgi:hypothetical protein